MLRDIVTDQVKQTRIDGITYSFDSTRNKWLSIGRRHITYGINHKNVQSCRWLAIANGIYTNNVGFKIPDGRSDTITAATVQSKNITSCSFMILENDDKIEIGTLQLNDENEKTFNLNIDTQPGAVLKCFIITNGNSVNYPFVVLECAAKL